MLSERTGFEVPPDDVSVLRSLRAGQQLSLTGVIYTARDAAHKRMYEALARGEALPVDLEKTVIYYAGPSPAPPGRVIGSIGPTTSYRMDTYTPRLMQAGLRLMIGKGARSAEIAEALKQYGGVYFAGLGGAGALLSSKVIEAEVIAYEDLGTEAIHKLTVRDFPVVVAMDAHGGDIYRR